MYTIHIYGKKTRDILSGVLGIGSTTFGSVERTKGSAPNPLTLFLSSTAALATQHIEINFPDPFLWVFRFAFSYTICACPLPLTSLRYYFWGKFIQFVTFFLVVYPIFIGLPELVCLCVCEFQEMDSHLNESFGWLRSHIHWDTCDGVRFAWPYHVCPHNSNRTTNDLLPINLWVHIMFNRNQIQISSTGAVENRFQNA
jgi:hypothetical protein